MRQLAVLVLLCSLVVAGAAPATGVAPDTTAEATPADTTASAAIPETTQATASATTPPNNSTTTASIASAEGPRTVTLLTYNDIQTAAARDGNFSRMVQLIHERRQAHTNPVVVAGAGDQIGPHPLSPVSQWRAPVSTLNLVQPDADVIGNHEFDYGLGEISNVTEASEFPWLASNLVNSTTGEPFDGTENYTIVEKDGVKVGFIGLVDEGATYGKITINFSKEGITLQNFTEDGPETAEYLKEQKDVDVVVALAHTGVPEAKELARADDGAIDVIAVGDDELYYPPQETSGTVITEGRARAQYLGELNLTVENGDVVAWNGRLIEVSESGVEKNESASRIINGYRANASLDSNITYSTVPLDATFATNYHEESNYGNLVTDAMRAEGDADVAITNSGGIRSDGVYGPGNITGGDVFSTLPFANTLVTVELTGAELKAALESQIVTLESETGKQFGEEISQQTSGVRFEWVPHDDADEKIRDVYVNANGPNEPANWEQLDEDATYTVAVNSYMASGGSSYPLENATRVSTTDQLLAEVVIDYLQTKAQISPTVEGRMQRVDADIGDATVSLDESDADESDDDADELTLRFDAPSDLTAVVPGTYALTTPDNRTVQAEQVTVEDGQLVVTFDADSVDDLTEEGETKLDLYGEYESSEYAFVYFENARLNGDVTVTDADEEDGNEEDEDEGGDDEDGEDNDGDEDGEDGEDGDDETDHDADGAAYQLDVALGQPIDQLGVDGDDADDQPDFYGTQGRLLQAKSVLADGTVTRTHDVPVGEVTRTVEGCSVSYDAVTYDAESGTASVSVSMADDAACEGVTLTLAAYELPGDDTSFVRANADEQELVGSKTVTLDAGSSGTVSVAVESTENGE